MTNYVFIATSLDGFIADPEGGIEWLNAIPNPEGSDFGWAEFLAGIDAILMGRMTFETVLGFPDWPYQIPVFVWSTTLQAVPAELAGQVEILRGGPREVVALLQRRGYHDLSIDGGKTVQSFLAADLIDELILTRVPILLGKGIPLFGKLTGSLKFEHLSTKAFPNGLVQSRYWRMKRVGDPIPQSDSPSIKRS